MSNREALRNLSRKYPAPPEIEKIWKELHQDNDRAIAIVSAAIIEAALEKLIAKRFKSTNKNLQGQIFLNRGPLSDFHSKILLAEAFGIITSPLAEQLHSIKAIRNVFAHAKVAITFDHEIVMREVESIAMFKTLSANPNTFPGDGLKLRGKSWFHLIAKITHILVDGLAEHPGTADEAFKDALKKGDGSDTQSSSPEK